MPYFSYGSVRKCVQRCTVDCTTLGEVQKTLVKSYCFVGYGVRLLQLCDAESSFGLGSVLNAIRQGRCSGGQCLVCCLNKRAVTAVLLRGA